MSRLPTHRRTLDIEVDEDDRGMIVTGHLQDSRPWQPDPERQILHDMTIELLVDPRSLTITAATSSMSAFPHAECPLVTARFGNLVGLSIASGYSRSLREVFGGVTGCAHVYELARAAGAAVVQGNMSRQARTAVETGKSRGIDPERLKAMMAGTCHIWSADGPGPTKLELGWRPGRGFPAPPVEQIRAESRDRT